MKNLQIATLGGGCFWCVEAIYQDVKGVEKVVSGYAGGKVKKPTYREVCSGLTGHAEVVQVYFDPDVISFKEILFIFWRIHDPTTPNRQGADVGTQYRSVILYQDETQKAIAEKLLAETEAGNLWPHPIVTEIAPLGDFYAAEDYHQNYYKSNPNQRYCRAVIDPKVQKFRQYYKEMLVSS